MSRILEDAADMGHIDAAVTHAIEKSPRVLALVTVALISDTDEYADGDLVQFALRVHRRPAANVPVAHIVDTVAGVLRREGGVVPMADSKVLS